MIDKDSDGTGVFVVPKVMLCFQYNLEPYSFTINIFYNNITT